MLTLILVLFFLSAFFMGKVSLLLIYGRDAQKDFFWEDKIITGTIVWIGLAEAAHLGALLRGQSVSVAQKYFLILSAAVLLLCIVITGWNLISGKKQTEAKKSMASRVRDLFSCGGPERVGQIVLAGMILIQLGFLLFGTAVYTSEDITLETVMTFLKEDVLYGSNPLTGQAYLQGIPSRLKILCLPTLYSVVSRTFSVSPEMLVYHFVPAAVLLLAYLAYLSLGRRLFPGDPFYRILFMILVSVLVWAEDAMYGLEGFGLLHCGYQGTTIRSAVLLPFLFGSFLRRKWRLVIPVLFAEACLVWTLYGLGIGAASTVFYLLFLCGRKYVGGRKEGTGWVNS